jgi:hybrid cluster-associated redox disulfide protein
MKEVKISRESNLAEVVFKYPKAAKVLLDRGMHCVGCVAAQFDTIEAGAKAHGFSDEDVESLVAHLNEVVK